METNEEIQTAEEVVESTDLVQIEFKLPVIPEQLNINGVDVSDVLLLEKEKEADGLKIKDHLDDEGYEAMKEFSKQVQKIRTKSEDFRNEVSKPVRDVLSDFKKRTDGFGAICKRIEAKLEPQLKKHENYKEEERKRKAELAKVEAEKRAILLVENGMVYNGAGTYRFPEHLDQSIFVLSDDLIEKTDDEFDVELAEIKTVWGAELERLAKIKEAEDAKTSLLANQVADLNEERTEFRKEQLEGKGFLQDSSNDWVGLSGTTTITEQQILTATKDEWKELLNPTAKVETKVIDFGIVTPHASPIIDVAVTEEVIYDASTETIAFDVLPFVDEQQERLEEIRDINPDFEPITQEAQMGSNNIYLEFDDNTPFQDTEAKAGFKMRFFHNDFESVAMEGIDRSENSTQLAFEHELGDLRFALIKA